MIKEFKHLTAPEIELLLKAPVLFSVLAVSGSNDISGAEKAEAVKLAHLKTYTADTLLLPYYAEVEKNFNKYFNEVAHTYAAFNPESRQALKQEINLIETVITKLDKPFAKSLLNSLAGYADHVEKADRGFFVNMILPFPIVGFD